MDALPYFLLHFAVVPVAAAVAVGLGRFRRLGTTQRYLLALCLLALLMEVISRVLAYYKQPNLFLAPVDAVIELVLLGLIYRRELRPAGISRLIPWLLGGFVLGSALAYSPSADKPQFSPVQHFIECLLVLAFVGFYFHRELNRRHNIGRLECEPIFWISTGLLLYFLSNMLLFLASNYLLTLSKEMNVQVWAAHALLYMFLNVMYALALWLPEHRPAPPQVTQS
ncbi:hypothetical protein ACFST9_24685 [Hymenobacter monticola]|uniref:DUF2306 domain-containing protein n=1 Tax=Hymenobacter monticola TaxID=1705399 RepID=A0ABY4BAX7_9BACT|nr:hypothetical protein [Hymenobacter monticola]UOE34831.1 hypothetical protein MTP16_04050 [Hymenobacter monticola]